MLEKKAKGDAYGWRAYFWADWKVHKRYDSEAQAIQAHEGLVKSEFYRSFDWRIVSPLGTIVLR